MSNTKNHPAQSVTWATPITNALNPTYVNYPHAIGSVTMTSTGTTYGGFGTSGSSFGNFNVTTPIPLEASDVVITKDGLMIECQWGKVRIPHKLLADLLTMAQMGLLDKLAPDTEKQDVG